MTGRRLLRWLFAAWSLVCIGPPAYVLATAGSAGEVDSAIVGFVTLGVVWVLGTMVLAFLRLVFVW